MCCPGFREFRLLTEPATELPFWDTPYRSVCSGDRIAVISGRKEGSLGKDFSGPSPLKNDRTAVFMVPYQVNTALQHDKERNNGIAQVEQVFGRTKRPFPPAH